MIADDQAAHVEAATQTGREHLEAAKKAGSTTKSQEAPQVGKALQIDAEGVALAELRSRTRGSGEGSMQQPASCDHARMRTSAESAQWRCPPSKMWAGSVAVAPARSLVFAHLFGQAFADIAGIRESKATAKGQKREAEVLEQACVSGDMQSLRGIERIPASQVKRTVKLLCACFGGLEPGGKCWQGAGTASRQG